MIGAIIHVFRRLLASRILAEVESRYFVPGVNEGEVALTEKASRTGARPVRLGLRRHRLGTMIGTGIFLKPAEMAAKAAASPWYSPRGFIGAILSSSGVLFAELGFHIPEAGASTSIYGAASAPSMDPLRLDAFHRWPP